MNYLPQTYGFLPPDLKIANDFGLSAKPAPRPSCASFDFARATEEERELYLQDILNRLGSGNTTKQECADFAAHYQRAPDFL